MVTRTQDDYADIRDAIADQLVLLTEDAGVGPIEVFGTLETHQAEVITLQPTIAAGDNDG